MGMLLTSAYRLLTMIRVPSINLEIFDALLFSGCDRRRSRRRAANFERFGGGKSSSNDGRVQGDARPGHCPANGIKAYYHHGRRRLLSWVWFWFWDELKQQKLLAKTGKDFRQKGFGTLRYWLLYVQIKLKKQQNKSSVSYRLDQL